MIIHAPAKATIFVIPCGCLFVIFQDKLKLEQERCEKLELELQREKQKVKELEIAVVKEKQLGQQKVGIKKE
jgi:hypothetical protein